LRGSLKIGEDPGDCGWPRVAAVAQIEDKSRISDSFPSKTGWSRIVTAQEFFHLSEQIHLTDSL
jgi:hypothetical protein